MFDKKREPRKTWYLFPFIAASLFFILVLVQVIYLKTPKVGPWAPPDTGDIVKKTWYGMVMFILCIVQGINGLYQYNKQKDN